MNIPDDAFYGLVTQGMRQRTDETLQRALYHFAPCHPAGNPGGQLPFARIARDCRSTASVA